MYKHVFRTLAQFASLAVVMTAIAAAQGLQTGEIAGRVSSQDGLSLPGVTVTVGSASLQGARTVVVQVPRPGRPETEPTPTTPYESATGGRHVDPR